MRKLIVHEFMTLDGVMQAPGGRDEDTEGDFRHGGWTIPYWHDDIGSDDVRVISPLSPSAAAYCAGMRTFGTGLPERML